MDKKQQIFDTLVSAMKFSMGIKNEYCDSSLYVFKNNYEKVGSVEFNISPNRDEVMKALKKAIESDYNAVAGVFTVSVLDHGLDNLDDAKEYSLELLKNIKESVDSGDSLEQALDKQNAGTATVCFLWNRDGSIMVKCLTFKSIIDEEGDLINVPTEHLFNDSEEETITVVKSWVGLDFFDGKDSESDAVVLIEEK